MVTHYRWDFIGLSTDDKPTPDTSEKVTDGSTFYCSDNSKLYVWYKDQWYEKEDTGGGGGEGIIELTEADYNNSEENPTYIQAWKLPAGFYIWKTGVILQPINQAWNRRYQNGGIMIRGAVTSGNNLQPFISMGNGGDYHTGLVNTITGDYDSVNMINVMSPLVINKLIDNLTTTSTKTGPLDAHQGYVLKGLIDALDARVTALGG